MPQRSAFVSKLLFPLLFTMVRVRFPLKNPHGRKLKTDKLCCYSTEVKIIFKCEIFSCGDKQSVPVKMLSTADFGF